MQVRTALSPVDVAASVAGYYNGSVLIDARSQSKQNPAGGTAGRVHAEKMIDGKWGQLGGRSRVCAVSDSVT